MPKTTYLDNNFINAALRQIPFTSPLAVYLALYTTAPTVGGGGVEVSGGSYARQIVVFTAPVLGVSSNNADVLFPVASVAWGTIVAFGVFDASAGGSLLYFNTLSTPRTVLINDQVRFPLGQLIASEA